MTNETLIEELVEDGYLKTPALIDAFKKIDRAAFVPEAEKAHAYENRPLALGHGQTISQPLTVAFMLELLEVKRGEKILDVGTGSGWQTALLAELVGAAGRVVAIERLEELWKFSGENLSRAQLLAGGTVKLVHGDGSCGYPAEAPYDRIVAAAAGREIPTAWREQVKVGGRIVAPVGEAIVTLDKTGPDEFEERVFHGFRFVPLVPGETK